MHPHLDAALRRLDESRAALRAAVEAVPEPLRTRKPIPDHWSVAEVLEHLALVERKYLEHLPGPIASAKQAGLGPETGPRTALPAEIDAMLADRASRRAAPDGVVPSGTLDAAAAMASAEAACAEFRSMVSALDGLALGNVVMPHHRFGPLNLYQWVEFIAGHESRHVEQLRESAGQLAAHGG